MASLSAGDGAVRRRTRSSSTPASGGAALHDLEWPETERLTHHNPARIKVGVGPMHCTTVRSSVYVVLYADYAMLNCFVPLVT